MMQLDGRLGWKLDLGPSRNIFVAWWGNVVETCSAKRGGETGEPKASPTHDLTTHFINRTPSPLCSVHILLTFSSKIGRRLDIS